MVYRSQTSLKGWWFVAFGDVGVVEFAFGGFGFGGVVGAGVAAFGHHGAAVAGGFDDGWFAGHRVAVGSHSCREQVQAAGVGDVGVAGRAGPDDGAVG